MRETLVEIEARIAEAQRVERVSKLEAIKSLADELLNLPVDSVEFGDKALELRDALDDCD